MFGNSPTPPFPPCPDSGGEGWGVGECICHPALSAPGCYCSSLYLHYTVRKYIYVIQTFYLHPFLPLSSVYNEHCTMYMDVAMMPSLCLRFTSSIVVPVVKQRGGEVNQKKGKHSTTTLRIYLWQDLSLGRNNGMKWVERAVSIVLYPISIPPPFLTDFEK